MDMGHILYMRLMSVFCVLSRHANVFWHAIYALWRMQCSLGLKPLASSSALQSADQIYSNDQCKLHYTYLKLGVTTSRLTMNTVLHQIRLMRRFRSDENVDNARCTLSLAPIRMLPATPAAPAFRYLCR